MKFDLISDFHVEMNIMNKDTRTWKDDDPIFYAWDQDKKSDVLVVAGDISNSLEYTTFVLREALDHYPEVIFTDGNHEHYSNYMDKTGGTNVTSDMNYFRKLAGDYPNLTYFDGDQTKQIGSTLFIGANGWYDFTMAVGMHTYEQRRAWKTGSNDPRCIRFGKKNKPDKLARRQADQLAQHVKDAQDNDEIEEIVVVTHTIPHLKAMISDITHPWYQLNGAYGNGYMSRVWASDPNNKIKLWVFGHTHYLYDFVAEGFRFVSNPRGYRGEKQWSGGGRAVFSGIKQLDTQEVLVKSAFGEIEP